MEDGAAIAIHDGDVQRLRRRSELGGVMMDAGAAHPGASLRERRKRSYE
jgi:hypothetical protein